MTGMYPTEPLPHFVDDYLAYLYEVLPSKASLDGALKASKIEELNTDAIKVGEDNVIIKAKDGKSLDLMPVLLAMGKSGFSAKSITVGAQSASLKSPVRKVASAKSVTRKAAR